MCPPPNILSTKSDYFSDERTANGRTDSVLRPPTYKALRAKKYLKTRRFNVAILQPNPPRKKKSEPKTSVLEDVAEP